ncbi:MAG: hypothetical protein H0U01_05545 [Acidimicrobiia bacterium]|nr:hypothetical protein [Acidimicrobiia bacterium]
MDRWQVAQRYRRPLQVGVVVVVVAAFAIPELWTMVARSYTSTGDRAIIEQRTREVFSGDIPLVGAFSRYGWSHPGPLSFYSYAIPYRLLGQQGKAVLVAALAVNAAGVAVAMWMLARRGLTAFFAGIGLFVALFGGWQPHSLIDPWNPTIAVVAVIVFLVSCWAALCGDRVAPAFAVFAASFVFQSHAGFALVVAPASLLMAAVLVRRAIRNPDPVQRRSVNVAGVVGAVVSLPLLVDSLTGWPGNLGEIIEWNTSTDLESAGFGRAVEVFARATSWSQVASPRLPEVFNVLPDPLPGGTLPGLLLVALAAAAVVAVRRGLGAELWLLGVVGATWLGGFVAITNSRGPQFAWFFGWIPPLVWMSWAAVAIIGWRVVDLPRRLGERYRATPLVAGLLAALLVVAVVRAVDLGHQGARAQLFGQDVADAVDVMSESVEQRLDRDQPIRLDLDGEIIVGGAVQAGVINRLERDGYDVVVEEFYTQYGEHQIGDGGARQHLLIVGSPVATPAPEGSTLLASSDQLPAGRRSEVDALTKRLRTFLVDAGRDDLVGNLYGGTAVFLLQMDGVPGVDAQREALARLDELRGTYSQLFRLYLMPA